MKRSWRFPATVGIAAVVVATGFVTPNTSQTPWSGEPAFAQVESNATPTWTPLGGGVTADAGATTDPDPANASGAYVFVRGNDGGVYWKRTNGSAWSSYNSAGGFVTSLPYAVTDTTGVSGAVAVYVFARGGDGALYVGKVVGGAWQGWQSLGGFLTSFPTAAVDASGSGVWVGVRGGDNGFYVRRLQNTWSDWIPLGGSLTSAPAMVADSGGVRAFAASADGSLIWRSVTSGFWQSLGGLVTATPSAVGEGPEKSVFVRGGDGGTYWAHATSTFEPFVNLGGYSSSAPAGLGGPGGRSVYVRGGDGALYRKHFDGTWGGWERLGGYLNSDPVATVDSNGLERVFVVGGDFGLYTISVATATATALETPEDAPPPGKAPLHRDPLTGLIE